jgi:four helix bundle protein
MDGDQTQDREVQLKQRMLRFSIEIIRLVEGIPRSQAGEIIGKQLIRCATSIGANYRSACKGRSKPEFIAKLGIAEEEADETQYWLEILSSSGLIARGQFEKLHTEASELTAILTSSGKTARLNR